MDYLLKMRRLGAATPDELPGELKTSPPQTSAPDNTSEAVYVYMRIIYWSGTIMLLGCHFCLYKKK